MPEAGDQFPTLLYFRYEHLPKDLQEISRPFMVLASQMAMRTQKGADPRETAAGLRKLLEAKDCAVRAALKR
jgi:hypothetical protein